MHQLANTITSIRILCSIALLFCAVLTPAFVVLYISAGLTDIVDGWIARRTNTTSELGSKLDTIADFIFFIICSIKLLPIIDIPTWIYAWIGIITFIKLITVIYGFIVLKRFITLHTTMNKLVGALLFLFPLTLNIIDLKYSTIALSLLATFSAIQEMHYIAIKRIN